MKCSKRLSPRSLLNAATASAVKYTPILSSRTRRRFNTTGVTVAGFGDGGRPLPLHVQLLVVALLEEE